MQEVLLKIDGISKQFPGVQALDDIHLNVIRGEVHAIVGENGAGKSTLMNILSGVIERDEGTIIFNDQYLDAANPGVSQKMGISTVYQELALAMNMSIMNNVFLWDIPSTKLGFVNTSDLKKRTTDLLHQLGIDLKPESLVKNLTVSEQQLVEIAKALSMNATLIIMDEPNSALSPAETEFLFDIIRKLRERGVTILFISHRLDEVFEIADRITVLRDGKLIGTVIRDQSTIDQVVSMMVGRELKKVLYTRKPMEVESQDWDGPILSVDRLSCLKQFKDISIEVHPGEIFGIFGLVGAGRTQLAEAVFGIRPLDEGEIKIEGKKVLIHSPFDAVKQGVGLMPEDRKFSGLFIKMAVSDNLNMTSYDHLSSMGFINKGEAKEQAKSLVDKLDIRLRNLNQRISSLSGGNQQKAILGRWLAINPKILILDEPTRGIDVGAKAQIYELIQRLADDGVAILLISSELEEILAMSDRIAVMRRGMISAEFSRSEATSDLLMLNAA